MKKIYILTAVLALLTLSLNAQRTDAVNHANHQLNSVQAKGFDLNSLQRENSLSINDMLNRFNPANMVKPESAPNGSKSPDILFRAPLRLNSGEETVGPFTGDNFDVGMGLGNAYSSPQEIFIETDLLRSEYANHIGDDIIGFRLALYGDGTQTVNVGEFMAWPITSGGNYDQDHLYTWSIGELTSTVADPYYEKVTSTADLESGAEYLIVYETDNVAFDGSRATLDAGNNVISVTRNGNIIESNATTDASTFTITANGSYYTIRSKSGKYIGRTSSSNGFNESATTVYNNSITFNNNNVVIRGRSSTNTNASNTYYLRFNSATGTNNYRFRYYGQTSQQNIQLYKKVTPTAPAYVALQDGQWHEFYLDEPVPFIVGDDNAGLSLGYTYIQYPTGTTGQNLFPMALNSQSTTHNHYAYMTVESQGSGGAGDITITCQNCFQTSFYYIIVVDNATGDYLTYWAYNGATYTNDNGQTCWELPNGWSLDGATYFYQETVSGYNLGYLSVNGTASIVISSSAFGGNTDVSVLIAAAGWDDGYTVSVNGEAKTIESGTIADYEWNPVDFSGSSGGTTTNTGWQTLDFSQYGDLAVQLIFKSDKLTPDAPTVTSVDGNTSTTITITPDPNTDGDLEYYVIDQNGQQTQDLTFPRGEQDYTVEVHAYTTEGDTYNESPEAVVTVTIPAQPKTAMPTITYVVNGDNVVITATGNGTVTLNIPGYPEAQGNGSASITVPCGVVSSSVTATATAQEDGKQESDPRVQTITIPAGEGWIEMDGTYNNPGDLLTMEKNGEDIMLVDQFLAPTLYNNHPDGYTYTMKETVNNVDWYSNPAPIPVHKTSSTLQGLYTQTQVDNDTLMQYRANVLNTEIDFNVEPDPMVMYYDLYRGAKNAEYPSVVPTTEISRLQQFIDNVNNNIEYFYFETHQSGIAPRYDHVGEQLVERIDTGYVDGIEGDHIAYVPVLWVPGQSTARGDGKNNSYGSDIKQTWLGGVTADFIKGSLSTNSQNGADYGTWEAPNGTKYCVYTPYMRITGFPPADYVANDDDEYTFEPYMFRVWCIYDEARDFTRNDKGQLIDAGELGDTILMQTVLVEEQMTSIIIGTEQWVESDGKLECAFGVPVSLASHPSDLNFVIRFYYKRNTVEGGSQPSGLRGNRDGAEEFAIVETRGTGHDVGTAINEMFSGKQVVSRTYVNSLGMTSDKPFNGVNIVITRYSDGTTSTSKIIR